MRSSIKRISCSVLLALLLLGGTGTPAQAQFGISAGLDFDSVDDIETTTDTDENATLDNSTGYHLGIVYDLSLGPVSLRPGAYYRKVGTYDFPDSNSDVTAWEFPLDIRLTVVPIPVVSPYLVGGPKATFPQAEGEFEDQLEDVSYTFDVGVGADVSVPGTEWTLQPELRYEFGATDYVDESFEIGGTEFEPSDPKFSAVALRLTVLF